MVSILRLYVSRVPLQVHGASPSSLAAGPLGALYPGRRLISPPIGGLACDAEVGGDRGAVSMEGRGLPCGCAASGPPARPPWRRLTSSRCGGGALGRADLNGDRALSEGCACPLR